jgi:prepilin peptidase CpaA
MMSVLATLSQVVLVVTAGTLLYVAFTDLKEYTVRNELVLVLAGLFFLHAVLSGRWTSLHWNLGLALVMFAVMLYFYSQKLMGGGDLKLLTVAFLWVGLSCALPFAVLMLIFAALHTLSAKLEWVHYQEVNGRKRIAFAPSVAAALIGVFMLGCLQPRF